METRRAEYGEGATAGSMASQRLSANIRLSSIFVRRDRDPIIIYKG